MILFSKRLLIILALAVVARAGILVFAEYRPERFDYPDSHRYVRVARNIAAGLGPKESDSVLAGTDPLYPSILAVGARLGFDSTGNDEGLMRFGRMANAFFGLVSVVLLFVLGRRIAGETVGLVAAAILALDPILLFFNALVLTETCYTMFLLAAFCCLTNAARTRGFLWLAVAGLLLGLGTTTRSTGLLLPILIAPIAWRMSERKELPLGRSLSTERRIRLLGIGCFLLASMMPLVPFVVRNYSLFGRFVPVRTGGGASLMEALGPWADGGPGMDRIIYPDFPSDANECVRDSICRGAALDWASRHPGDVGRLALIKLKRTWSLTISAPGYSSSAFFWIAVLTVGSAYAFAAYGLCLLRGRFTIVALLLSAAAYFSLVHCVFVGSVRYRVPAMPTIFILAAVGMVGLMNRLFCRTLARSECPDRAGFEGENAIAETLK